jgi:Cu2+-exporting ATPase
VDIATARVHVQWRASASLSQLLAQLAALGFKPYPLDSAAIEAARDGRPILQAAWHAVRSRVVVMDVPVAAALLLAFGASLWNTWTKEGTVYFDSVVMFVFFLILGRFVEMRARHRTGGAMDALAKMLPRTILDKPVSELVRGERVLVRPGEVVPADGSIVDGESNVDESLLTGESRPIARGVGDAVIGGALNLDGSFSMCVTALGRQSVLHTIVRLLNAASAEKSTQVALADRVAAWFLSRILLGAALVAVAWSIVDPSRAFSWSRVPARFRWPCRRRYRPPWRRSRDGESWS